MIKALSVVRPGGARIASGEKTLEVRRWAPGLGAAEDLLIVENGRFLRRDGEEDADGTPVAIVRVRAVRAFMPADMAAACASFFEEGWLAWELCGLRPVRSGLRLPARRGIYEMDFRP